MILLIYNLHYIGNEDKYKNGIYPASPERISRQLDFLSKTFQFISQKDLLRAVEGEGDIPERSCMVTFDDGLKCQFEEALPILQKKNIPTVFFVCSLPYVEKKVCTVHKIHWLRSNFSTEVFFGLIESQMRELLGKDIDHYLGIDAIKKASGRYRYDNAHEAGLKYLLTSILSFSDRERIINNIFSTEIADEEKFAEELYLTEDQIRQIYQNGSLGMHSYDHHPLLMFEKNDLRESLFRNKNHLENLVQGEIYSISYPYGSNLEVDEQAFGQCRDIGLKLGFTMERALNVSLENPLSFARADINDVVGGKHPLFKIENGNVGIVGKFSKKRKMFHADN